MSQTTPPIFDYTPIMEEVCRIIAGRLGRSDLANLLQNMQLLEIKAEGENLEVILQPAEAWQKRLITSNAISLIELALSQQLDQPCQVYFI